MIFAAGLGTRLHPLTNSTPKALVKLNGITMLERIIKNLIYYGFDELIINVHHFPEQIINFIKRNNDFGIKIAISHEDKVLLDTGGGLKKASWFFDSDESFLVHNVDIISNTNLLNLYNYHIKNNALATLAVRERESSRYLLFDNSMQLCGWENINTKESIITRENIQSKRYAFSGIHIISPSIFKYIKQDGAFSIIKNYLELSSMHKIIAYPNKNSFWFDIGTTEKLNNAEKFLNSNI